MHVVIIAATTRELTVGDILSFFNWLIHSWPFYPVVAAVLYPGIAKMRLISRPTIDASEEVATCARPAIWPGMVWQLSLVLTLCALRYPYLSPEWAALSYLVTGLGVAGLRSVSHLCGLRRDRVTAAQTDAVCAASLRAAAAGDEPVEGIAGRVHERIDRLYPWCDVTVRYNGDGSSENFDHSLPQRSLAVSVGLDVFKAPFTEWVICWPYVVLDFLCTAAWTTWFAVLSVLNWSNRFNLTVEAPSEESKPVGPSDGDGPGLGFRFVEVGEALQVGDQVMDAGRWKEFPFSQDPTWLGSCLHPRAYGHYRRKVAKKAADRADDGIDNDVAAAMQKPDPSVPLPDGFRFVNVGETIRPGDQAYYTEQMGTGAASGWSNLSSEWCAEHQRIVTEPGGNYPLGYYRRPSIGDVPEDVPDELPRSGRPATVRTTMSSSGRLSDAVSPSLLRAIPACVPTKHP